MTRAAEIAAAWVELQTPESLHRIRPHVIRAARGKTTRAARLLAMFAASPNHNVTSDEIRCANAAGAVPRLRDAGAHIESYREGRVCLYVYVGGIDIEQAIDRDSKRTRRAGVFCDRYVPATMPPGWLVTL